MFGKRSGNDGDVRAPKPAFQAPEPAGSSPMSRESAAPTVSSPPLAPAKPPPAPTVEARRSDNYYQVKATIFGALIEAIDLAQPGDVIVVDAGGVLVNAIIGEIMSTLAEKKGVAGFVIDGSIRDAGAIRAGSPPERARIRG